MGVGCSQSSEAVGKLYRMRLILMLVLISAVSQAVRRARKLHSGELERQSRFELLKEASNKIDHGPEYISHHKQIKKKSFNYKPVNKKSIFTKKSKLGHIDVHQPANTRYDHDNIHLQRLDYQQMMSKKKTPKTFNQMMKKKSQKPNKKMDKMYKKMLEKEKMQLKKKNYKKAQRKHVP